jgi:hypothetical protein
MMGDRTRGLYEKFDIRRTDGKSAPGEKHENCQYFVLDLTHDPHALPGLRAYRQSCQSEYPKLAYDLGLIIGSMVLDDMEPSAPALSTAEIAKQVREWAETLDHGNSREAYDLIVIMRAFADRVEAEPSSPTLADLLTSEEAGQLKRRICRATHGDTDGVCTQYDKTGLCQYTGLCHVLWTLAQKGKAERRLETLERAAKEKG